MRKNKPNFSFIKKIPLFLAHLKKFKIILIFYNPSNGRREKKSPQSEIFGL